jgi:hypothetical protein
MSDRDVVDEERAASSLVELLPQANADVVTPAGEALGASVQDSRHRWK